MRLHSLSSMAASLLLAVSAGCVGEYEPMQPGGDGDDPGPGEELTAREMYDDMYAQQLAECGACHSGTNLDDTATGPDYMGPDQGSSYETLLAYRSWVDGSPIVGNTPDNSKLLIYGAHAGPAFSPELLAKMEAWVIKQAEEDGLTPEPEPEPDPEPDPDQPPEPTPPATLTEALTMFSNCMTYEDFEASNFENVADQNSAEGQCYACHSQGTGGAYLSANNIDFYVNQRKMPYLLKFVTGTVNEDGSFRDLIISGRYEMKRDDNGHPNYLLADARIQSIEQFFELTYVRYQNAIQTGTPCTPDDPVQQ